MTPRIALPALASVLILGLAACDNARTSGATPGVPSAQRQAPGYDNRGSSGGTGGVGAGGGSSSGSSASGQGGAGGSGSGGAGGGGAGGGGGSGGGTQ